MTSSSVVCCFLSTFNSFRPNKEGLMLCSTYIKAHTHTLASLWTGEQTVTIRPPQLFTKREPNLLFSVLPFISLSHPVFWPSTILFVASPPSASEPRMTPSQFPAFLSAPVPSCFCRCLFVTFLFPRWRKFSSCLYRFGQNLKKATCCRPCTAAVVNSDQLYEQNNAVSLWSLMGGGGRFPASVNTMDTHLVFSKWPVTKNTSKKKMVQCTGDSSVWFVVKRWCEHHVVVFLDCNVLQTGLGNTIPSIQCCTTVGFHCICAEWESSPL